MFILLAGSANPAIAEDREQSARTLSVQATAAKRQSPCNRWWTLILVFPPAIESIDESRVQEFSECLDHIEQSVRLFDKLLNDYPETAAAYELSKEQMPTRGDVLLARAWVERQITAMATVERVSSKEAESETQLQGVPPLPPTSERQLQHLTPKPRFEVDRIARLLSKAERQPSASSIPAASLTDSEIDNIRHQIERCWSVPSGARDADDLVILIRIFLNPDGTLSKPPSVVNAPSARFNAYYQAAAESARRAVLRCTPFSNLPSEKYEHWRELTLEFNPRRMLGG